MVAVAENAKVPVCAHLDHGTSLDMIYKAFRLGFTSVMMDTSALPYEENLRLTKMINNIYWDTVGTWRLKSFKIKAFRRVLRFESISTHKR